MYKWTDANGVTQYSETPPPGRKAEEVQIKVQPRLSDSPATAPKDYKQQELEFQQRRVEAAERESKAKRELDPQSASDEADLAYRCAVARQWLRRAGEMGSLPYRDKDGTMRSLDYDASKKLVADVRQGVAKHCGR